MKILLLSIYLLLSLSIPSPSMASDLEKLYPQKLTEAKNLYPLAKQYFTGPGSLAPGETLTPEMVKSRIRLNQFYKLRRLLGLAIDAGYDLSYLAEFGLIKQEQGYYVNIQQHPQWAPIRSLFLRLREPSDMETQKYYLQNIGFSSMDIEKVHHYLDENNPNKLSLLAERTIIKHYVEKSNYSPFLKSSSNNINQTLKVHEEIRRSSYDSWNKWGKGLLNELSRQKQRILLNHLQEKLSMWAISGSPIDNKYLTFYEKEIREGSVDKRLNNEITRIDNKLDKDNQL